MSVEGSRNMEEKSIPHLEWKTFEFHLEGAAFRPSILELDSRLSHSDQISKISQSKECNSVLVKFDVSLGSSLNWDQEVELMEKAQACGKKIFLDLDFGLGQKFPSLSDMAPFLSLGLGIDTLKEKVIEPMQSSIMGVFLLRGEGKRADFSSLLPWDGGLIEEFFEFEKESAVKQKKSSQNALISFADLGKEPLSNERRFLLEVFSKDLIINYLNLLLTQLPQNLAAFIHFRWDRDSSDALTGIDPIKEPLRAAYLLERRSLGHIHLAWESEATGICFNSTEQRAQTHVPTVGILLPDRQMGLEYEKVYNEAISKFRKLGLSFRFVSSEAFHEEWHLLDFAVGAKKALSREAIRQVIGFNASGGVFVFLDEAIENVEMEAQVSIKAFISEQIKPLIAKATMLKDSNKQTL